MAEGTRLIFMGTSAFADIILQDMLERGSRIAAVYTQPDRPAGRGMRLAPSPVKVRAIAAGLPVLQPASFRQAGAIEELAAFRPDFLIAAAYGLILPQAVLDIPAIAPVNIHASLLPAYRGAAPVQRAIMENWRPGAVTGVSIMRMEAGLDTGPVYAERAVPIGAHTAGSLMAALAALGARLLAETLPGIASGAIAPKKQDDAKASYAPKITREDAIIDWQRPAAEIDAQIRAVTPKPGAKMLAEIGGAEYELTITEGKIGPFADAAAGDIFVGKNGLRIAGADNWYEISMLIPTGRKEMAARDFINGLRLKRGHAGKARKA